MLGGGARIEKKIYRFMVSKHPTFKYIILEDVRKPLNKYDFDNVVELQYEDMVFPCPAGYKNLLTEWYGDYMQIPEEGKKYLQEEATDVR